jgi:hypothetical protein
MNQRCNDPNRPQYKDYGGRGVTVCERWQGKYGFENFLKDMGKRPEGFTLGRIGHSLLYSPETCEWQSRKEQENLRNKRLMICGKLDQQKADEIRDLYNLGLLNQAEIAEKYGIHQSSVSLVVRNKTWNRQ